MVVGIDAEGWGKVEDCPEIFGGTALESRSLDVQSTKVCATGTLLCNEFHEKGPCECLCLGGTAYPYKLV